MKQFYVGIKGVVRQGDAVLVLKKNQAEPFWEICGGRIDGDETIEQTLKRELEEELPGITQIEVGKVLCAHRLPKNVDGSTSLMLIYYEVKASLPEPIQLSDEHTDYKWIKSSTELSLDGGTLKAVKAALGK